ncbi:alpha/beta fold hydrolase [Ekhidna sp.]|uniref:alpha/beta fold hydrolase n=1 Tax=Ekhidna sp. TaxID=2608089 RepID=UPI003CCB75FE
MQSLLNYQVHLLKEDADWIVFLHGAGGSIATWKYQISDLKRSFNILAIDLRDHGLSKNIEPSFDTYDFNIVVDDVKKVLEEVGVARAHFVTLSFGSVLMQAVYDRDPSLVKSMTLIGGIFNANWMIKAFVHSARFLNLFLPYHWMYRIFSYLLMPKKNHQVARRVYQRQARKLSQSEYLKWLGLYSEFFSLLKSFHQQEIDIPTIIIMGDEDYLFLPSAKGFAKAHSKATLVTISNAGHICNIERPKEVNQTILDFLDSQKDLAETPPTKETSVTN